MKKKIAIVVILLVIVGAAVSAYFRLNRDTAANSTTVKHTTNNTDGTETGGAPSMGFACSDLSNPFFATLQKMLELESGKEGYVLVTKDAGSDNELQLQQIQELIDEGVELVFLCPVDWEAVSPALEALNEAGIPIVNIDRQVKDSDEVSAFVGTDNRDAGALCGADLLERCPDGGKVVILECPGVSSVMERITGFEKKIAKQGFEIVSRANVELNKESAKEVLGQILENDSDIDIIMCGNDQIALGAMEAAKDAGLKDVLIYGVDGSPDFKEELNKSNTLLAGTATQSPIGMGETAVKVAMAILNVEEYKQESYTDTYFISRENVSLYGVDGWQ